MKLTNCMAGLHMMEEAYVESHHNHTKAACMPIGCTSYARVVDFVYNSVGSTKCIISSVPKPLKPTSTVTKSMSKSLPFNS